MPAPYYAHMSGGGSLTLRIRIHNAEVTKTVQFDPSLAVYDACARIREKVPEARQAGNATDFGLFIPHDDPRKGLWLEPARSLDYYMLHSGDTVEYRFKYRWLYIRTMDGTKKTLQVDDSKTVAELMVPICTKMGIANHEEYSLIHELDDMEKERTLTLRRDHSIAKDQEKLEKMKKKLRTDDDLNWLVHSSTLRQQGIQEKEILLLRRKYFFSDQNVDGRDPVQLSLLYVQLKDAILNGAHPVTQEEAIKLAGMQCQVEMGDFKDTRNKVGTLDLKEYLPKEYIKVKGIEKKIINHHKTCKGSSETDAKVKYCQFCRSLKTYGITFFLVKERVKGKSKLVPRLLGITKDSVVRVDEKTKDIIKTWPLTTVKRWAASPNSFTLDFGDYSDAYYPVQTTEGEQIAQLISGYIDIFLKKQKAKDHVGIEGDEESAMYEDNVQPAKAVITQHMAFDSLDAQTSSLSTSGLMHSPGTGRKFISEGNLSGDEELVVRRSGSRPVNAYMTGGSQQVKVHELSKAQRALVTTIDENIHAIRSARDGLEHRGDVPELGPDDASRRWREQTLDVSKQNISSQLGAMSAATARLITLTTIQGDEEEDAVDFATIGTAVATIGTHISHLMEDVKTVAGLEDGEVDDDLFNAARRLADAFTDLLKAAQPMDDNQAPSRKAILEAASKVGEASHELLRYATADQESADWETVDEERAYQDALLTMAKGVANATAALVLKAKTLASETQDQMAQQRVIASATQTGLATSQLVACTKVVAPSVQHEPDCQNQLSEAANQVAKSVSALLSAAEVACDDPAVDPGLLTSVQEAAMEVQKALNLLLEHVRRGSVQAHQDDMVESIVTATDRLFHAVGDGSEMAKQARILALASSDLVVVLKTQAEQQTDTDQQRRLFTAAKALADATTKLVEAAKPLLQRNNAGCANDPTGIEQQQALKLAAEHLKLVTHTAGADELKIRVIRGLQYAARVVASASTQLVNTSQAAAKKSRASNYQVCADGKAVAELIPKLVMAIRATRRDPEDPLAQLELINMCSDFVQPCDQLLRSSKSMSPTVLDGSLQSALDSSVQQLTAALSELKQCLAKSEKICRHLDQDGAIERVRRLAIEVEDMQRSAHEGLLRPLPGSDLEESSQQLANSVRSVGATSSQLCKATISTDPNVTDTAGQVSRDMAGGFTDLVGASRCLASLVDDSQDAQVLMLSDCRRAVDAGHELLLESKRQLTTKAAMTTPQEEFERMRDASTLNELCREVTTALSTCLSYLPGQREADNALRHIGQRMQELDVDTIQYDPGHGRNYSQLQSEFSSAAVALNQASGELVGSQTAAGFANNTRRYTTYYDCLVNSGIALAGGSQHEETRHRVVGGLKNVSDQSCHMLQVVGNLSADPHMPGMRQSLQQAAKQVSDSLNALLSVCATSVAPGQRECDAALRQLESARGALEHPVHPLNSRDYFGCLENISLTTRPLAEALTGITAGAKSNSTSQFCESVRACADCVTVLVEDAAQAAYLVGVSDPHSEPGRPGLVDLVILRQSHELIAEACNVICDPLTSKEQIVQSASVVAGHTSTICNTCRQTATRTTNPVAKRQLVQSAKEVANATTTLITAMKLLDKDFTDESRQSCIDAASQLMNAVSALLGFVSGGEFAPVPAKITPEAEEAQRPIQSAGTSTIDGAVSMIHSAKTLMNDSSDPQAFLAYSNNSKTLSEAIKRLVHSIKQCAPGQKECSDALVLANNLIHYLDKAHMDAMSQRLNVQDDKSESGFQQQLCAAAREIRDRADGVVLAGRGSDSNRSLALEVDYLSSYLQPLTDAAIGAASRSRISANQQTLLEQSKTILEAVVQLLSAAKECGGNSKAVNSHGQLQEASSGLKEVCDDLVRCLDELASRQGHVNTMIDALTKAVAKTGETLDIPVNANFVDYQTRIVRLCKQLVLLSQDMVTKGNNPHSVMELGPLANQLTQCYSGLCQEAQGAVATQSNEEIAARIQQVVQAVGQACIHLVRDAGAVQVSPDDPLARGQLGDHSRLVQERIADLLAALQAGSRGTQACINAASTVSGIIADLDTTILFASAGTLNSEVPETAQFANHREAILKTAKALVEDTKTLVTDAAKDQEKLAASASTAVSTITRLADVVKLGAATLGNDQSEAQVMLINAAKDVASALADLINAAKNASAAGTAVAEGSSHEGLVQQVSTLKDSAKVMVQNVTTLLKTVKTVEDETLRGSQALDSAVETLRQDLRTLEQQGDDGPFDHEGKASAEELLRTTQPIMAATGRVMTAGNSLRQEDVMLAANAGRQAVTDLIRVSRGGCNVSDNPEVRHRLMSTARQTNKSVLDLLVCLQTVLINPVPESKQRLAEASRMVAECAQLISHAADGLKEGPRLVMYFRPSSSEWRDVSEKYIGRHVAYHHHYVRSYSQPGGNNGAEFGDSHDPSTMAERELLGVASQIEAAAKKLAQLRPRKSSIKMEVPAITAQVVQRKSVLTTFMPQPQGPDELSCDEIILDSARCIMSASAELMRAAGAAQQELVSLGRLKPSHGDVKDEEETQWSHGLISAARLVAAASHNLCESANALVEGHASEERLISAAKQVASSTAQLLVACKVKADINSVPMRDLQRAGQSVKKATEKLVEAAHKAIDDNQAGNPNARGEGPSLRLTNPSMVNSMKKIILTQEDILKKERELSDLRNRLVTMRHEHHRTNPNHFDVEDEP